jgi:hypothetical protein
MVHTLDGVQAPPLRTPHRTHMHSALECRPHSAQNLSRRSSTSHSWQEPVGGTILPQRGALRGILLICSTSQTHQISRAPKGVSLLSLGFTRPDDMLARQVGSDCHLDSHSSSALRSHISAGGPFARLRLLRTLAGAPLKAGSRRFYLELPHRTRIFFVIPLNTGGTLCSDCLTCKRLHAQQTRRCASGTPGNITQRNRS